MKCVVSTMALVLGCALGSSIVLPAAAADPASGTAQSKAAQKREADERRQKLHNSKKVAQWPTLVKPGPPPPQVVNLDTRDCSDVGGSIHYWPDCSGTRLMCRVGNRSLCIDEVTK